MKKIFGPALFIVFTIVLVIVLLAFFPKYAGMLTFIFFFLLFDGYLWFSLYGAVRKMKPLLRAGTTILYWFAPGLLLVTTVCGFFVSFLDWNLPLRTYVQSTILVLFLSKSLPILALVISDLARTVKYAVSRFIRKRPVAIADIPRSRPVLATGWVLGIFLFMMLVAGTLFWQFDFTVNRQEVTLKDLPPAFDGLKIVQFSDAHLGSWGSREQLQKAMKTMNGLHPDVIFFTGDMFNYCTADGQGFGDILQTLQAPFGIYTILGNHDYGDYINWPSAAAKQKNMADLKLFYQQLGWRLLLNEHEILKKGTDSIAVIGVQNWGASHRFQRFANINQAQKGTETMAIQLLLSHDPSFWDKIISKKYQNIDITLSGHTHGGQVGIDCFGIHWSPITWAYRHWCGLYTNPASAAPQYLYVNQGLGNIGYSGRIGIMPEITLIILKRVAEK